LLNASNVSNVINANNAINVGNASNAINLGLAINVQKGIKWANFFFKIIQFRSYRLRSLFALFSLPALFALFALFSLPALFALFALIFNEVLYL